MCEENETEVGDDDWDDEDASDCDVVLSPSGYLDWYDELEERYGPSFFGGGGSGADGIF